MEAQRGRDAIGGSMRSTRARSGIAGDAQSLGSVEKHLLKRVEPRIRLHAFPRARRNAHPRNRLYDETRKRKAVCSYIRKSAGTATTSEQGSPDVTRPANHRGPSKPTAEETPRRKAGCGATVSRPCCATRSGCALRPRLRPGGRRWSPGTTGHPAPSAGRADSLLPATRPQTTPAAPPRHRKFPSLEPAKKCTQQLYR